MLKISKLKFDKSAVLDKTERATRRAMFRAAAYAMKTAQRRIRYRSYTKASKPGQSPFKHRRGANSFSHSIQFSVAQDGQSAIIGPRRQWNKRANISGPVPHTLEFGGKTQDARNSLWVQKKNQPTGINTLSGLVNFFQEQGVGPIFMAKTRSGVVRQMRLGEKAAGAGSKSIQKIRKQKAPDFEKGGYRTVYTFWVRLRSRKQAEKAAANTVKYFGYPAIKAQTIAPRPFMGPALDESRGQLSQFFHNIVN